MVRKFFMFRHQRVLVNGESSDWYNIASGVPQGSILGPLLFVLYVNDIPEQIDSVSQMFADDLKIYRTITDSNDKLMLQNDLNTLAAWSNDWLLKFNIDKCMVMHLGHDPGHQYTIGNSKYLSVVHETKDLGIWIDAKFNFSLQCTKATNKAMQALGLIKRTFKHVSWRFLILYKTYVRPYLEYCTPVWNPEI